MKTEIKDDFDKLVGETEKVGQAGIGGDSDKLFLVE